MSGVGAMMAGGNPDKKRGRQEDDFYPTPKEVTRALMRVIPPRPNEKWWEPCCGDGSMANTLTSFGASVLATDINPRDFGDRQDFFDVLSLPDGVTSIITNPPFDIAEKFIRHAWETLKVEQMALVLKATYWHAASRQALFRDCTPCVIMPLTWRPDFLGLGRPTMEVMWCLWDRKSDDAPPLYIPLSKE